MCGLEKEHVKRQSWCQFRQNGLRTSRDADRAVEATKVWWLHSEFVMKGVQELDVRKTGTVKDVPI